MKSKRNPFAFMSSTYADIMGELKRSGSRASYRNAELTVGLNHKCMMRLKKGTM